MPEYKDLFGQVTEPPAAGFEDDSEELDLCEHGTPAYDYCVFCADRGPTREGIQATNATVFNRLKNTPSGETHHDANTETGTQHPLTRSER